MAELASGAVSSLLSLLRNEALLLSRVGSDVEFIKEEMESMHSFLEHLARTVPPAGGHDEQVRTWMKQVRDLAHDCSNFIDLYLRRGDPAVYRARTGRWRYIWWAFWLVQKTVAQHKAAIRLHELKERARDVGKRRLRYGVEIPGKDGASSLAAPSMPSSPSRAAAVVATMEDDDEEDQNQMAAAADGSDPRALEPHVLEEYCAGKLDKWLQLQAKTKNMASIAIVAPDDTEDAGSIARESLTLATANFTCKVWVNLSELHLPWDLPLLSWEILSYILRQCEQQQGTVQGKADERDVPLALQAYRYKDDLDDEISDMIGDDDDIDKKIEEIKSKIEQVDEEKIGGVDRKKADEESKSLGILLRALRLMQNAPDIGVPLSSEAALEEAASRLKDHIEAGESKPKIRLDAAQYIDILRKVLKFRASKPPQAQAQEADTTANAAATTTTLGEDHIKEILHNHKITLDIICKLLPKQQQLEGNSATATGIKQQGAAAASTEESKEKKKEISGEVQTSSAIAAAIKETNDKMKEITGEVKAKNAIAAATINDIKEKVDDILSEIEDKVQIKGIVDKIKPHLKCKKTLIILQDDKDYISTEGDDDDESTWEGTRNALNLLGCAPGSAVIVSTKNSQKAKEFCYPPGEPITCSLVGLYHDIVLQLTQQQANKGMDGYNPRILRKILDKCHPHEFCMKIFADALYANPKRSYEELQKLHQDLATQTTLGGKAKKMLRFSYKDLPREYKTCLLYLAIFPQGHNVRRSTLIGRWVTEGLITKQDWRTAVLHADRCFDALIKRGLVLPCEIGDAGKVKSCMVGDQVHVFITKIANKEHILDARLSDLWARHFSIFSGIRLRTSDSIEKFVHRLPKYLPQLPLLKVLDLEGINCFEKNHYLKDICNKILLLKYLSLRRTNVSHIPSEINNLHELEVLDIRQTKVPEHATRHVLLLKLRRFLADRIDPVINDSSRRSAVQIPLNIEMMENLEVLSNVRASKTGTELKDIRHLWQLRKLGVVIQDKNEHLDNLLRAVGDLKECLQSLSVTISDTRSKRTPSSKDEKLKEGRQPPKHLESLTINGSTERVQLLNLLAKGSEELAEVTLSGTLLEQNHLIDALAVLPKLHCLRLQHGAYNDSKLTFSKEEFSHLKYFLVEGTNMNETEIKFEDGATAELEKIVLSFTNIRSLGGIDKLPKLKELELKGNEFLHSISEEGAAPGQSTESRVTEENTQSRAPEQNTESRAPEQNSQGSAPKQNTQDKTPEQNTESRAMTVELLKREGSPSTSQTPEQSTTPDEESSRFTFKKEKFKHLKYFRVEHSKMAKIIFEDGAAPELKKIALSLTNKQSQITGVSGLPKLKEIELRGDKFFLSLFEDANRIAKVILSETQLKQADIQILANKTNLRCLVLSDKSYDESQLAFNKVEFPKLELLIVECPNINRISFTSGSAPMLKKIVWSFTEMKSLSGINNLPKLMEMEFIGDLVPYQVRKDIAAHIGKPVLTHKKQ